MLLKVCVKDAGEQPCSAATRPQAWQATGRRAAGRAHGWRTQGPSTWERARGGRTGLYMKWIRPWGTTKALLVEAVPRMGAPPFSWTRPTEMSPLITCAGPDVRHGSPTLAEEAPEEAAHVVDLRRLRGALVSCCAAAGVCAAQPAGAHPRVDVRQQDGAGIQRAPVEGHAGLGDGGQQAVVRHVHGHDLTCAWARVSSSAGQRCRRLQRERRASCIVGGGRASVEVEDEAAAVEQGLRGRSRVSAQSGVRCGLCAVQQGRLARWLASGTWDDVRVLPVAGVGCWAPGHSQPIVSTGSLLSAPWPGRRIWVARAELGCAGAGRPRHPRDPAEQLRGRHGLAQGAAHRLRVGASQEREQAAQESGGASHLGAASRATCH